MGCGDIYRDREENFKKKIAKELPTAVLTIAGQFCDFFLQNTSHNCNNSTDVMQAYAGRPEPKGSSMARSLPTSQATHPMSHPPSCCLLNWMTLKRKLLEQIHSTLNNISFNVTLAFFFFTFFGVLASYILTIFLLL